MKKLIILGLCILLLTSCKQLQDYSAKLKNYTEPVQEKPVNETVAINQTEAPPEPPSIAPRLGLAIYFLKASGNSVIVMFNNESLLVNAGRESDAANILQSLRSLGVTRLSYLVLSNGRAENIGGAPYIILKTEPSRLYDNGLPTDNVRFYTDLYEKNKTIVSRDTAFFIGGAIVRIYVPYDDGLGLKDNPDSNSMVVRITYDDFSMLLMNDCDADCEERILDSELSADVIQVSNSCNSTSLAFLKEVNPDVAFIRNDCPEVKKTLHYLGVDVVENQFMLVSKEGIGYKVEY